MTLGAAKLNGGASFYGIVGALPNDALAQLVDRAGAAKRGEVTAPGSLALKFCRSVRPSILQVQQFDLKFGALMHCGRHHKSICRKARLQQCIHGIERGLQADRGLVG